MNPTAQTNATPRRNGNRPAPRKWLPLAGACVLIALIVAGLWPKPVPVETARVTRGSLRATVDEEGKTRVKQRYLVSAPVSGQLRRIPFKAGFEVKANETVVAVLDPLGPALLDARSRAQAETRRDSARANLEKAAANSEFAASELRRYKKLFAEKTATDQEVELAQMRDTAAAQEKSAAQSALRQAELELEMFNAPASGKATTVEIKAPATGRVLRVLEENSRAVTLGTPLLEIGDPADLEVVIEVLSRDGAAIEPGAKVYLEQWGGATPLEAKVRLVEPAAFTKISALGVEEQRVNVIADLITPAAQRSTLGDHYRVDARIVVWETANTLKVPLGAVFRRGDRWAAYVLEKGQLKLRQVTAGRIGGSEIQIIDGLQEGDQVVLYPGDRAKEGLRVKPISL